MSELLDFFAIVGGDNDSSTLQRVSLNNVLQAKLSDAFHGHSAKLCEASKGRIKFDGRYSVSKDELFCISAFSLPEDFEVAVDDPTATELFDLTKVDPFEIRGVVGARRNAKTKLIHAVFQEFRRTRLLLKGSSWALLQSKESFVSVEDNVLSLADHCDAVFEQGSLFFSSYWATNRFLNLSHYYRDATDVEIRELLQHPRILAEDAQSITNLADSTIRRKFNVIQSTKILDVLTPAKIKQVAKMESLPFELTVRRKGGTDALVLPTSKAELKDILTFLCEGIYHGPLTGQVFKSNSHRPLQAKTAAKKVSRSSKKAKG